MYMSWPSDVHTSGNSEISWLHWQWRSYSWVYIRSNSEWTNAISSDASNSAEDFDKKTRRPRSLCTGLGLYNYSFNGGHNWELEITLEIKKQKMNFITNIKTWVPVPNKIWKKNRIWCQGSIILALEKQRGSIELNGQLVLLIGRLQTQSQS